MDPKIDLFFEQVNPIVALDAGRAGNIFFLTIFDKHPEVLTCPLIQYFYSCLITEHKEKILSVNEARETIIEGTYFKYIYNDLDEQMKENLFIYGCDPTFQVNRAKVRKHFDAFLAEKETISRKDLVLATYLSYAIGIGRNIDQIRYILMSDALSLREENPLGGFSGKVIEAVREDFPEAKFIRLVRDQRANFASVRHQFLNARSNMYGIQFGNYHQQLGLLLKKNINRDYGCVFLYWLCYLSSATQTVVTYQKKYPESFSSVKNEDLNLNFVPTMEKITTWLNVSMWEGWKEEDYSPTMIGKQWRGAGSYNSRRKGSRESLQDDPKELEGKLAAPNAYVTKRWRTRLSKNEIKLLEILFHDELQEFSYELLHYKKKKFFFPKLIYNLLFPFQGEILSLKEVFSFKGVDREAFCQRFFYLVSFPPFYLLSRIVLVQIYMKGFFHQKTNK